MIEDHSLSDRDCNARAKAYNIKRVMALETLSMSKTNIKYPAIFSNSYYTLADDKEANFPQLPNLNNNRHT